MVEAEKDILADSFRKNKNEIICVGVNEWRIKLPFYIRIFVLSNETNDYIPTQKGISLPIEKFSEVLMGFRLLNNYLRKEKIVSQIKKSPSQEVRIRSHFYNDVCPQSIWDKICI